MITNWLILTRAVHFGACLIFFGVFAFDRFVTAPVIANGTLENYWRSCVRRFQLILLPIILLSGIVWFALVAVMMGGVSFGQLFGNEILETVWQRTQFGMVWKLRLLFWLAAAGVAAFFFLLKSGISPPQKLIWLELIFSGLLLGSLAWTGHGREGSRWHLFADVLHLLVAGIWPAGLLPFALLFRKSRRLIQTQGNLTAIFVSRFSAISLAATALLAVTGFVNGWFLVGSFSNLVRQTYGRWLLAKIILFCFAVSLGAVNLLRLKPRLFIKNDETQEFESTAARLQFNVRLELFLALLIVIVVAILGILPPAAR